MLQRAALGLAIVFLLGGGAIADETAPPATNATVAPVDSHLAAAIDLLVATNAKANIEAYLDTMLPLIVDMVHKNSPNATPETLRAFQVACREEMVNSLDDVLKLEAQVYVQHFSEEELRALSSFYRSDVGQKYLTELPRVMKETAPIGEAWGRAAGGKAMQRALERLKSNGVKL